MNIQHGKSVQLGTEYVLKLLDSIMVLFTKNTNYRWRGLHNSIDNFSANDVVLHIDASNVPRLVYATVANSGVFDSTKWEPLVIKTGSGEEELAGIEAEIQATDNQLHTLIRAITGSDSYKGTFNPDVTYSKNDIVTTVFNGVTIMVRANENIDLGPFDLTQWSILKLMTENEVQELSGGATSSTVAPSYEITLPAEGWVDDTTHMGYMKRLDLPNEHIEASYTPCVIYHFESLPTIKTMGMCPVISTENGMLHFYSLKSPEEEIQATMVIIGMSSDVIAANVQKASKTRVGGVIVGDGLKIADDGTLSVDETRVIVAASDEEAQDVINESLGL